jgi:hypothetical protein
VHREVVNLFAEKPLDIVLTTPVVAGEFEVRFYSFKLKEGWASSELREAETDAEVAAILDAVYGKKTAEVLDAAVAAISGGCDHERVIAEMFDPLKDELRDWRDEYPSEFRR